jgi:hypothetical protein
MRAPPNWGAMKKLFWGEQRPTLAFAWVGSFFRGFNFAWLPNTPANTDEAVRERPD